MAGSLLICACSGTDKTVDQGPVASSAPRVAIVDAARIATSETQGKDWLTTGRTYSEQRFSPLKLINADNVAQLGLTWFADFDMAKWDQQIEKDSTSGHLDHLIDKALGEHRAGRTSEL